MNLKLRCFIFFVFVCNSCLKISAQNNDDKFIDSLLIYLDRFKIDKIEQISKEKYLSPDLRNLIRWHLSYIKNGESITHPDSIVETKTRSKLNFFKHFTLGEYYQNKSTYDSLAHKHFSIAKDFAQKTKNKILLNYSTKKIIQLFLGKKIDDDIKGLLEFQIQEYKKYNFDKEERLWSKYFKIRFESETKRINHLDELLSLVNQVSDNNFFS